MDFLFSWANQIFGSKKTHSQPIANIAGKQYVQGTTEHQDVSYQYATSSYKEEHDMNPAIVIQPKNKEDIKLALRYARQKGVAVAIRTGGHQYSGASSTGGDNIQLDIERTFQGPDDRKVIATGIAEEPHVYTSVSWSLGSFNSWLAKRGLFIPHGQCTEVHLGGHVQTGGYGQLARAFGLFGDHLVKIYMIDYEGNERVVTKESDSDPELFWAILGGSPGNFGVLTHLELKVYRDCDYIGSRGLKALYLYNTTTLKRLLDIIVRMSDDPKFPPNYDLCISVLSSSFKIIDLWLELDGQMREDHPKVFGENGENPLGWPRTIIVYAQWVPLNPDDTMTYNPSFFTQFNQSKLFGWVEQKAMSKLTSDWIFRNVREFEYPYVKRTYTTNSTTLQIQGWAAWVTDRIDQIVRPEANRCWLSAQIQCFGGQYSRFRTNADNGTSFSWRDTTMGVTLDCFHRADRKSVALEWARVNDDEGIGEQGKLSREDRRWLWGSWGEFELDRVWDRYHEDRDKYERLGRVRKRMDPEGLFSPNALCVKRATE